MLKSNNSKIFIKRQLGFEPYYLVKKKKFHLKKITKPLQKNSLSKKSQNPSFIHNFLSQPTLLRASEARLTGASSKGGKCAESPPTFICGKRRKNRRKPVKMKILSSGVVFTFEEGISTSHLC